MFTFNLAAVLPARRLALGGNIPQERREEKNKEDKLLKISKKKNNISYNYFLYIRNNIMLIGSLFYAHTKKKNASQKNCHILNLPTNAY